MPNPGIDLGESEDIIIVGMGNPFAKTYNVNLPDGSTATVDPAADIVTDSK